MDACDVDVRKGIDGFISSLLLRIKNSSANRLPSGKLIIIIFPFAFFFSSFLLVFMRGFSEQTHAFQRARGFLSLGGLLTGCVRILYALRPFTQRKWTPSIYKYKTITKISKSRDFTPSGMVGRSVGRTVGRADGSSGGNTPHEPGEIVPVIGERGSNTALQRLLVTKRPFFVLK